MKRLVALLTLLGTLGSERADACTSTPLTGLEDFTVLPGSGSTAPRNAQIWIPAGADYLTTQIVPSDIVVEQDGVAIAVDVRAIPVAGETDATLYIVTPIETFAAGASIQVRAGDAAVTQFTVLVDEDVIAPAIPVLDRVEVTSGYFGYWSCGDASEVAVTTHSTEDTLVLTDVENPDVFLAISATPEVHAFGLASGDFKLQLASIDVAGNASEPVALPELTVPDKTSGCSSSGASGGATLLLVLAAIATSRLRRSSWRERAPIAGSVR